MTLVISSSPMKDVIVATIGAFEARGLRVKRLKLTMAQLRAACRGADMQYLFSEHAMKLFIERSGRFTFYGIPVTLTDGTETAAFRSIAALRGSVN